MSADQGLLQRVWQPRVGKMFIRNTVVSTGTFLVGLVVMVIMVKWFGTPQNWAAAISFLVSTTLHYVLGRTWVFAGSDRSLGTGYVYFLVTAGVGTIVTVGVFSWLMNAFHLHYLVARIIASIFAGLTMFVLNLTVNFKDV